MVACEAGDMLAVGADLVIFDVEGDVGETQEEAAQPAPKVSVPKAKKAKPSKPKLQKSDKAQNKALASPAVRKRAKDMGVDLAKVSASGKDGQVTQADLDLLEKTFEPEEGETRIKVIGLRRVISQRMQEAKRHIPHFTYVEEIDVTELESLRKRLSFAPWQSRLRIGRNLMPVSWMRVSRAAKGVILGAMLASFPI